MAEILRAVGVIARALDSIANVEFKQLDLNKGQYLYVVRIAEAPGIIQERLAELIKVDKTTAARAIQQLTKSGIVIKKPDATNRKIRRLYLTKKGAAIYPFLKRENDHSNLVALSGLSEQESEQLQQLLQRVSDNVDADWQFVKKGGKRLY